MTPRNCTRKNKVWSNRFKLNPTDVKLVSCKAIGPEALYFPTMNFGPISYVAIVLCLLLGLAASGMPPFQAKIDLMTMFKDVSRPPFTDNISWCPIPIIITVGGFRVSMEQGSMYSVSGSQTEAQNDFFRTISTIL